MPCSDRSAIVEKYSDAFNAFSSRKKSDAAKQLFSANREPRHVRCSESGGMGTSSRCNSLVLLYFQLLHLSLFLLGTSSDSGTVRQRTYTAESSLAAFLGKSKEVKSDSRKSTTLTKREAPKKISAKNYAKGAKKDVEKCLKINRNLLAAGSKSE